MSLIRFFHVDHLRLGSPLTGLSDCPEWLCRTVEGAVRTAVCNLIESAVAHQCHFVVLAGRLAESAADLPAVTQWLSRQLAGLARHQIRIVVCDERIQHLDGIASLNPILLAADQRLDVWRDVTEQLQFSVRHHTTAVSHNCLCLQVSATGELRTDRSLPSDQLLYLAHPAVRGSVDSAMHATDGALHVSAGAPQAVGPDERGAFGGRVVEADLRRRHMEAKFVALDSVRFLQHELTLGTTTDVLQLSKRLQESCLQIPVLAGRTHIVDWLISGSLEIGDLESGTPDLDLDERSLLLKLRQHLQAGHSGIWPRRIRFSDLARIASRSSNTGRVVSEFLKVATDQANTASRIRMQKVAWPGAPMWLDSGVAAGLEILDRVV